MGSGAEKSFGHFVWKNWLDIFDQCRRGMSVELGMMLVALCSIHYTVVALSYLFTTSISDGYEEVFLMEAHDTHTHNPDLA